MNTRLRSIILIGLVVGALAWGSVFVSGTSSSASAQQNGCQYFTQTGHKICGRFLNYWNSHGGLAQQGYPLSEEFTETSDLNGLPYNVQYFERAVFELHPENNAPNDVLLSQLGTYLAKRLYTNGFPAAAGETPYYEDRSGATSLLKSYYNAVNRREFDRAYTYFEGAPNPSPSLVPSYSQFVAGYADTTSVIFANGKETVGAGAGNIYASVPVALTAKHKDGSTHVFAGCYTLHRLNAGISGNPDDLNWHISRASLSEVPATTALSTLTSRSCNP